MRADNCRNSNINEATSAANKIRGYYSMESRELLAGKVFLKPTVVGHPGVEMNVKMRETSASTME